MLTNSFFVRTDFVFIIFLVFKSEVNTNFGKNVSNFFSVLCEKIKNTHAKRKSQVHLYLMSL